MIFGQLYEQGVTDAAGQGAGVLADIGWGPNMSDPTAVNTWTWLPATYNVDVGNNDEYERTLTIPTAGTYLYTARFSLDGGLSYTYCDTNGAGSNAGLTFEAGNLGTLTAN